MEMVLKDGEATRTLKLRQWPRKNGKKGYRCRYRFKVGDVVYYGIVKIMEIRPVVKPEPTQRSPIGRKPGSGATAIVEQMACEQGVSVRTAWRRYVSERQSKESS